MQMTKMKMKDRIEMKAEKVVHGSHLPTKSKSTLRAWLTLTRWVLSQLERWTSEWRVDWRSAEKELLKPKVEGQPVCEVY